MYSLLWSFGHSRVSLPMLHRRNDLRVTSRLSPTLHPLPHPFLRVVRDCRTPAWRCACPGCPSWTLVLFQQRRRRMFPNHAAVAFCKYSYTDRPCNVHVAIASKSARSSVGSAETARALRDVPINERQSGSPVRPGCWSARRPAWSRKVK